MKPSVSLMEVELYIDGSCSPVNPGGDGVAGAYLCYGLETEGRYRHLGSSPKMSNNVAEYGGLLLGLEMCIEKGITSDLTVYSDSLLLVNQMLGLWKVKNGKIYSTIAKATKQFCRDHFTNIRFEWIAGTENPADGLTRHPYEVGTKTERFN